jgi:predicted lipid-binding transport protein (Tim44 family)
MFRLRWDVLVAMLGIAATLALVATEADARIRGGFGSRGTRTFMTPPPTATAPKAAQPIERSVTQPGQPGTAVTRPATTPGAAPGGFLNRPGLLGGLAAGFLGAGLFGLLWGSGFFSNLGGLAAVFGLLLQLGLIAAVAMLVWSWWQRRSQPAFAGGSAPRSAMREMAGTGSDAPRTSVPLGGASVPPGGDAASFAEPNLTGADFDTFERLLGEILQTYANEDVGELRKRLTPEMLSYTSEDLSRNASRGIVNKVSDVKLLQGDLAEAWREGAVEYATVAMRFSLVDRFLDRASGAPAEGDHAEPQEATELWTFMRTSGGAWLVSAIQQVEA